METRVIAAAFLKCGRNTNIPAKPKILLLALQTNNQYYILPTSENTPFCETYFAKRSHRHPGYFGVISEARREGARAYYTGLTPAGRQTGTTCLPAGRLGWLVFDPVSGHRRINVTP